MPSLLPGRQAVGANGRVGRKRSSAELGLYLGEGGAESGEVSWREDNAGGWGSLRVEKEGR